MQGIIQGNTLAVAVLNKALTPALIAANTTAEQTFSVTGLKLGDFVYVNKPTTQAGLSIAGARVSAADTLAITFGNHTAGNITPTAGQTYTIVVVRPEDPSNIPTALAI